MQIYGKFWEELHSQEEKGILVEVVHVNAHRTKFEMFVTEGKEKADGRSES